MRIVVAPDGFGGTLSAREAAQAIAEGWSRARPSDDVRLLPLSDGGEGLLDAVAGPDDTWLTTEVAGPQGHPVEAALLLRADGSALVESAQACGLHLVPPERRTPMLATTHGVGELLQAAKDAGARRILVGLGGSASVDGGAGALTGLGFRLRVADGSGLKVGGADLRRVARAERGWAPDWTGMEVVLLADVRTLLLDAAVTFGPQKGASQADVARLTEALEVWADVAERDLADGERVRDRIGTGAAGGLAFGLACGLGARIEAGAPAVAAMQRLPETITGAHLVVTGEGRLDATSEQGKVVGHVRQVAADRGVRVAAVVGGVGPGAPAIELLVESAPQGPGSDPAGEVAAAAERLAASWDG